MCQLDSNHAAGASSYPWDDLLGVYWGLNPQIFALEIFNFIQIAAAASPLAIRWEF